MKIFDYATNKTLHDVALNLTHEEAVELRDYLDRLVNRPEIHKIHLIEIANNRLDKEFTVALEAA
ncbi:MAG: hypothetical protein JSS72_08135 [Armatimonadetes bacterium]|nr:hypothetical protein [Armatimonadota bacterium]